VEVFGKDTGVINAEGAITMDATVTADFGSELEVLP
jgi:hypothetical protein